MKSADVVMFWFCGTVAVYGILEITHALIRIARALETIAKRGPGHEASGTCAVPPPGWRCTRKAGHDGPCAAVPTW